MWDETFQRPSKTKQTKHKHQHHSSSVHHQNGRGGECISLNQLMVFSQMQISVQNLFFTILLLIIFHIVFHYSWELLRLPENYEILPTSQWVVVNALNCWVILNINMLSCWSYFCVSSITQKTIATSRNFFKAIVIRYDYKRSRLLSKCCRKKIEKIWFYCARPDRTYFYGNILVTSSAFYNSCKYQIKHFKSTFHFITTNKLNFFRLYFFGCSTKHRSCSLITLYIRLLVKSNATTLKQTLKNSDVTNVKLRDN